MVLDQLKAEADQHEMTLAKYRMVLRLRTIDSEVTFESLKTVDMSLINEKIKASAWLLHPRGIGLEVCFESYRDYLNKNLLRKARIVNALGQLILTVNPDYFNAYLGKSDVEAKTLVELYHAYLKELQKVNILMIDQDYEALIALIKANPEFIELEGLLIKAIDEYKALFIAADLDKVAVLVKLEALIETIKTLHEKINARINEIINDEGLIGFYFHGEIIIKPVRPDVHPYVAIREVYAKRFAELGFSIDTYEAYVLKVLSENIIYATIKAEFDALMNELQQELNALKAVHLELEATYNLELKQRHMYLKAQVRLRGNN